MKAQAPASTRKKVAVVRSDGTTAKGYLSPVGLGQLESIDLLTLDGEHQSIGLREVRAIYFVRDLGEPFELERKAFLSRPKLDGLWVRLRFPDDEVMEGVVPNNLLELLDGGVQLTPPDLHGNVFRIFIPRSALAEMRVLGVVGVARRSARAAAAMGATPGAQSKLFSE